MSRSIPQQAVILIGGRGTRLGDLTERTPKPLLHVGGRPFIEYLIENFGRFGLKKISLLCGYRSQDVSDWLDQWSPAGLQVQLVAEPEVAGTAGALLHCRDFLNDEFFLANGDSIFDINLLDLVACDPKSSWTGILALRPMPVDARYGRVEIADSGRILSFIPASAEDRGPINGGVYRLKRDILDWIDRTPMSIEQDVFPQLAQAGQLYGRTFDSFFLDIGIPADFERAQQLVPAQLRRPAVFLDRDGVLNHDTGYVHRYDHFTWIDGAREAVKLLNDRGYYVFVVTNQAGVAHGYYEEDAVGKLHAWMQTELNELGAHIDRFQYCPFHPDGKVEYYRRSSPFRKPGPGMIEECFANYDIDKDRSFLIGDKDTDIQAAQSAGIAGHLFKGGNLSRFVADVLERPTSDLC